jgi:hypothetical protein
MTLLVALNSTLYSCFTVDKKVMIGTLTLFLVLQGVNQTCTILWDGTNLEKRTSI